MPDPSTPRLPLSPCRATKSWSCNNPLPCQKCRVHAIKSFQNAFKRNKQCYWVEEWATETCQDCPVIELGSEHAAAPVCNSHWALFSSCKKIKTAIHPGDRVQESVPSKSTSTKVICFSCPPWLLLLEQGHILHFYNYLWLITGIKTHWITFFLKFYIYIYHQTVLTYLCTEQSLFPAVVTGPEGPNRREGQIRAKSIRAMLQ